MLSCLAHCQIPSYGCLACIEIVNLRRWRRPTNGCTCAQVMSRSCSLLGWEVSWIQYCVSSCEMLSWFRSQRFCCCFQVVWEVLSCTFLSESSHDRSMFLCVKGELGTRQNLASSSKLHWRFQHSKELVTWSCSVLVLLRKKCEI